MGDGLLKYMGSKAWMLRNGLGEILDSRIAGKARFVDLFAGAGSVSWHMAERHEVPVLANDLQIFSSALCDAVIARTEPATSDSLDGWFDGAQDVAIAADTTGTEDSGKLTKRAVLKARRACASTITDGVVWNAYGGHYFSPRQALSFDALLATLPDSPARPLLLASLLTAATRCAASPGHLAQPLQPGPRTLDYLTSYWTKDVYDVTRRAFQELAGRHALVKGKSTVGDANSLIASLGSDDLVFVDPPYSGVHYSRFYHVLETMAKNVKTEVTGVGRYPPSDDRPRSAYSVASESRESLRKLLEALWTQRCTVVVTYPAGECSNGLSGRYVRAQARRWFDVQEYAVTSRFSTLGGRASDRKPHRVRKELVLTLFPKKTA